MKSPDGRMPFVRTVWFVKNAEEITRFLTAYPPGRRSDD